MLQIVPFKSRSQIEEVFASYDPQSQAWLVSDLRTKFELQQKILQRDGQYVDESVLRASDLWKILLKRLAPQLTLVSDAFAKSILASMMDEMSDLLGVNASAVETAFAYLDQLAPVLFHPEGASRLTDWFSENPEAQSRWQEWYLRSRAYMARLIDEYHIITADWITSFLQNFNELERVWDISLIVDLSGEMTRVEAEILSRISRNVDVVILEPAPDWRGQFSYLLKPYQDLHQQTQDIKKLTSLPLFEKEIESRRYSGMLAEIKAAVAQTRQWLDQGISPEAISIIAPDIELYWPVLQPLLATEGVPAQKDITHKIQSLPAITRWLSTLRSLSGGLSTTDLELAYYAHEGGDLLRYELFKSLYTSLYDVRDLNRHEDIKALFERQIDVSQKLERDDFVIQALKYWIGEDTDIIQVVLRELLMNARRQTVLLWKDWISYLQSIVALKETLVQRGQGKGVVVTKILSAHSEKSQYRFFLGLTDEALRSRQRTQLTSDDYFYLSKDLGYFLDNPDQSDIEFELRLLADSNSRYDIYCFGVSDLQGTLCSPSTFWMELEGEHDQLLIPPDTRWDEIQTHEQGEVPVLNRDLLQKRLGQDAGREDFENVSLAQLPRISASGIETYLSCPFKFAAQSVFKLQDLPEVDLDVDHRTRGRIAHGLFDALTKRADLSSWTDLEILNELELVKEREKLIFADPQIWEAQKRKHLVLAKRFIEVEKEYLRQFAPVQVAAGELSFSFVFNPDTGEIVKGSPSEGCFVISGRIDRVDMNGDYLAVIDYKSSSGGITAHGSWIEKRKLQLFFYMWILEKNIIEKFVGKEVVGLFYYIFKNFEKKGFRIEDKVRGRFFDAARIDKAGTEETKSQYMETFYRLLVESLQAVKQGVFPPLPADTNECQKCEWSRQCRAPHLN